MTNTEKMAEFRELLSKEEWKAFADKAMDHAKAAYIMLRGSDAILPDKPWAEINEAEKLAFGAVIGAYVDKQIELKISPIQTEMLDKAESSLRHLAEFMESQSDANAQPIAI